MAEAVIGSAGVVADRPGLRIELLADTEAIAISESAGDPEGPSPPLHLHPRHVESFYVLEGELTFTVDGRTVPAPADSVQVPPGVPHTFAPAGTDRLRFLNLHTPGCGYGAFLRGCTRPARTRTWRPSGQRSIRCRRNRAGCPYAGAASCCDFT